MKSTPYMNSHTQGLFQKPRPLTTPQLKILNTLVDLKQNQALSVWGIRSRTNLPLLNIRINLWKLHHQKMVTYIIRPKKFNGQLPTHYWKLTRTKDI